MTTAGVVEIDVGPDFDVVLPPVERVFSAFPDADATDPVDFKFSVRRDRGEWRLVHHDGSERRAPDVLTLTGHLVHGLNGALIASTPLLTLHAGGVTVDGGAVVLPGDMEAGKSTLTAGLVRAGCGYLSDEAIGIDPSGPRAVAYPKAITLDAGAHALFPELEAAAIVTADTETPQWQVPITAFAAGHVAGPTPIRHLVFPRFVVGAATGVRPLRRAEAVVRLWASSFAWQESAGARLELLAEVTRGATCHELVTGALEPAVAVVLELARAGGQLATELVPMATADDPPRAAPEVADEAPIATPALCNETFVPVRASLVHAVELDGETVLLDEARQQLHVLDRVFSLVWALFDGVSDLGHIALDLAETLDQDRDETLARVSEIASRLDRLGLLDRGVG